ncbi:MAG TPA: IscS subfamily cysteine desulfurase [Bacteroidota bacterium]|nr:IscS subfamily cysteine desulfurase [Bacteroidota bacterium]
MKTPVYMDNHATTPVDPEVVQAMLPYFTEQFGNPASRQHRFGWVTEEAVEQSRTSVADIIGADPAEIVFTSGATESNNLAIKGLAGFLKPKGNHIVTVGTEHKSVLDSCKRLEQNGYVIEYLPTDEFGVVDPEAVKRSIKPSTILVSVMIANNEIGTIQDIAAIGGMCREHGVLLHTDVSQAIGKIPVHVGVLHADLMSFTAHKIYGPKGIGALYVRRSSPRIRLLPQMDGGGHEGGMRSGTLNVPGIVGFGKALEIARSRMASESARLAAQRDRMWNAFSARLDEVFLNGHPVRRLPNNLNVSFGHVDDSALMMNMKDIAVSTGSACSTGNPEPSHVLRALRLPADRLHSSLRFGLGRFTTDEDVEFTIERVVESVKRLREYSAVTH